MLHLISAVLILKHIVEGISKQPLLDPHGKDWIDHPPKTNVDERRVRYRWLERGILGESLMPMGH